MKSLSKNSFYKLPILDGLEILDARRHALNFPFHTHNTFNITLVLEQVFCTRIAHGFFQAPVGTIVITNPEEVHSTICDRKIGSSFCTFYVSPDALTALNNKEPVLFEKKVITDEILFRQLFSIAQDLYPDGGIEKKLVHALRRLIAGHASKSFTVHKKSSHFQRFLEEEPFEKFSLEQAASKFGLDKFKFLRLFKQETGLTPNNYVILNRIERSKRLLQTGEDLLGIAIETGFYDATHFCKHFKRITGITPQAYRNG